MSAKKGLGSVHKKSEAGNVKSLKDQILNEEVKAAETTPISTEEVDTSTSATSVGMNEALDIDYSEGLNHIINSVFGKEHSTYQVINALERIFEARGKDIPFDDNKFKKICEKIAEIQAAREVAHLFGLGPEYSDRIANNLIDAYFGRK